MQHLAQVQIKIVSEFTAADATFQLTIESDCSSLSFKVQKSSGCTPDFYSTQLTLPELRKTLELSSKYDSVEKVRLFLEKCAAKKRFSFEGEGSASFLVVKIMIEDELNEYKIALRKEERKKADIIKELVEKVWLLEKVVDGDGGKIVGESEDKNEGEWNLNRINEVAEKQTRIKSLEKDMASAREICGKIDAALEVNGRKLDSLQNNIEKIKRERAKSKLNKSKANRNEEDFKSSPLKLSLNKVLINDNAANSLTDEFAVFNSNVDGKDYLISREKDTSNLNVYDLDTGNLVKKVEGHTNDLSAVRYFFNPREGKGYVVTADNNCVVIVWDETFKKIHEIDTQY